MSWYRTGTVTVAQNATAVVGTGTLWSNQIAVGDSITFDGGGKWYEISTIGSDTALTLATAFLEASVTVGSYAIKRDGPYRNLSSSLYTQLTNMKDSLNRGYLMTSTTSTPIATGSKTLTVEAGIPIQSGARLVVASRANINNAMFGIVTSYTGTTLVISVTNVSGGGTFADWNINIAGGVTQGPAGELTRSGTVVAGNIASWDSDTQVKSATAAEIRSAGGGLREVLTSHRTYYVRTDGNNANTGLSNTAGGAFLTIQKAIDTALALDCSIYNVTIQVASGTYSGNVLMNGPLVGSGSLTLQGDIATPSNVSLALTGGFGALSAKNGGRLRLAGLKISNSGANGQAVYATDGGMIEVAGAMEWGACPNRHHIDLARGGRFLSTNQAHTISGSSHGFIAAYAGSTFLMQSVTIAVTGSPNFLVACAVAESASHLQFNAASFSGAATGKRYSATLNGVIQTSGGGASFFPGDVAGTTATGGQYA